MGDRELLDRLWATWIEADDRQGTHYPGCEMAHWRCALRVALEAARAPGPERREHRLLRSDLESIIAYYAGKDGRREAVDAILARYDVRALSSAPPPALEFNRTLVASTPIAEISGGAATSTRGVGSTDGVMPDQGCPPPAQPSDLCGLTAEHPQGERTLRCTGPKGHGGFRHFDNRQGIGWDVLSAEAPHA